MKRPLLLVGLALVALWLLLWRKRDQLAGAADASQLPDGTDALGLQFGQIGSNVSINDTQGSVIATLAAEFFSNGGQGEFKYTGPDGLLLETKRFSVGDYTILELVPPSQNTGSFNNNPLYAQIWFLNIKDSNGAQYGYAKIVDRKPTFNLSDPSTYIIKRP